MKASIGMREADRDLSLPDGTDLKQDIIAFMRRASTEVTTHDEKILPELARILPASTVYVAHTPKARFEDVVRVALVAQSLGLRACPHLVARRLPSEPALQAGLQRLSDAGIDQALLIAGDGDAPAGPFADSLEVILSGILDRAGLRRLGIAGHPEGHPQAGASQLWNALQVKQEFGARTGIDVHVVTQFGFDPQGVSEWTEQFQVHGLTMPVHVGIAGPTSLAKLLRFAMLCGVGASLRAASKNARLVGHAVRQAAVPEQILPMLVALGAGGMRSRMVQPHIFTFGGAISTARWIRDICSGMFDSLPAGGMVPDGAASA